MHETNQPDSSAMKLYERDIAIFRSCASRVSVGTYLHNSYFLNSIARGYCLMMLENCTYIRSDNVIRLRSFSMYKINGIKEKKKSTYVGAGSPSASHSIKNGLSFSLIFA